MPAISSVTKRFQFISDGYAGAARPATGRAAPPGLLDRDELAVLDLEDEELRSCDIAVGGEGQRRAEQRVRQVGLRELRAYGRPRGRVAALADRGDRICVGLGDD